MEICFEIIKKLRDFIFVTAKYCPRLQIILASLTVTFLLVLIKKEINIISIFDILKISNENMFLYEISAYIIPFIVITICTVMMNIIQYKVEGKHSVIFYTFITVPLSIFLLLSLIYFTVEWKSGQEIVLLKDDFEQFKYIFNLSLFSIILLEGTTSIRTEYILQKQREPGS